MSNFVLSSLLFGVLFPLAMLLNTCIVLYMYLIFLFHLPINIYRLCLEIIVTLKTRNGSDIQ